MRWCWLWAVALAGCSGSPKDDGSTDKGEPGGCATGEIVLEPGTGNDAYEPLVEGDTITIVHGPQGGWHVETAGFVKSSEREIAIFPVIRTEDGLQITTNSQPEFKALVGYDEAVCEGTFFNTRAFVDAEAGPGTELENICLLGGRSVELSLTVADIVSGREATATVNVVAALDPIDVEACGQQ
jgi:hypothetical protein